MNAMTSTFRPKVWALATGLALVGFVAPAASADEDTTHFKIYGGAGYVAPLSDGHVSFEDVEHAVKAEHHVGWNLGIEGRFNKWLGLEIDYMRASQDVSFDGRVIGDTNFSPLTATFNIHVVHTKIVDWYLGPSYSYVDWGDIKFNEEGRTLFSTDGLATDSTKGWGVGTGLDIGSKHIVFTAGLRYIDVSLQPVGTNSTPVNPLVGRLGIGFRF